MKPDDDIIKEKASGIHTWEDIPPMGVSQWKMYGQKYHYWNYFEKITKKEERERIKELLLEKGHGGGSWRRIINQL